MQNTELLKELKILLEQNEEATKEVEDKINISKKVKFVTILAFILFELIGFMYFDLIALSVLLNMVVINISVIVILISTEKGKMVISKIIESFKNNDVKMLSKLQLQQIFLKNEIKKEQVKPVLSNQIDRNITISYLVQMKELINDYVDNRRKILKQKDSLGVNGYSFFEIDGIEQIIYEEQKIKKRGRL